MADGYPQRESHFAHKLTRLMFRTCAAQNIGQAAELLVIQIAHTEDAARYRRPVTFWNDQLMPVLGFNSWGQLDRARKAAVKAGWLHYEPGGKGKVGRYWAAIPAEYADLPDDSVDEDFLATSGGETSVSSPLSSPPVEKETGGNGPILSIGGERTEGEAGEKRGRSGDPSSLRPKPNPKDAVGPERKQASDSRPATPPPEPSEYEFPTKGKGAKTWTLPAAKLTEYVEAYPDLDVAAEIRAARQYVRDNGAKRKTPGGMLRYLTAWLNRSQNSGRGHQLAGPRGTNVKSNQPSGHRNQSGRPAIKSIEA